MHCIFDLLKNYLIKKCTCTLGWIVKNVQNSSQGQENKLNSTEGKKSCPGNGD